MASIAVDPFRREWVETSLERRAERVAGGASATAERTALFEELWPWAVGLSERMARRLPSHADADELRSRVLLAVWESTTRIDWDRPTAWPSLLKRRIQGARADAARGDDVMSRRQRQAYAAAASAVAAAEQRLGRPLTSEEIDATVSPHFPGRPDLFASLAEVVRARESVHRGDGPAAEAADERWEPERLVLDAARQDAVRCWLEARVPPAVARQVLDWARRERAREDLPRRLRSRVRPYVGELAALVSP